MSLRVKASKTIFLAKIFNSRVKNKVENVDESHENGRGKAAMDEKTGPVHAEPRKERCKVGTHQMIEHRSEYQRFRSSENYNRRRNAITEKDYFEFLRLKTKRVQQQVIDTYVYGWK